MFVSTRYQFIKNIANIFSQVFGPFQASSPGYLIKDKYDFLPVAHRLVVVVRGTFWSSNIHGRAKKSRGGPSEIFIAMGGFLGGGGSPFWDFSGGAA